MTDDPDDQSIAAHLFRLRDAKGNKYPREYLASQAGVQFIAGFDTTGHTLAYVLYHVATNPHVEAKLVEELKSHGLLATPTIPSPPLPTYDQLSKLDYLHAVVKEAMRLTPVVPGVGRVFDHDVQVGGYVIPRNVTIICSMYPSYINCWEDGMRFDPDRWLGGSGMDAYDPALHHPSKVCCGRQVVMHAHNVRHASTHTTGAPEGRVWPFIPLGCTTISFWALCAALPTATRARVGVQGRWRAQAFYTLC